MHGGQVNLHHFGAKGTALALGSWGRSLYAGHFGTVPYCRQKRNVPKCRLSPILEMTADGVDHALGRGLAEHIGCGVGIHKDIHERLQRLDLAARLGYP